MLRRFWFKFENNNLPPGVIMGCGITASDLSDAKNILNEKVFSSGSYKLKQVVEDIDISMLDKGHVLPNMRSTDKRGVWFPIGYE